MDPGLVGAPEAGARLPQGTTWHHFGNGVFIAHAHRIPPTWTERNIRSANIRMPRPVSNRRATSFGSGCRTMQTRRHARTSAAHPTMACVMLRNGAEKCAHHRFHGVQSMHASDLRVTADAALVDDEAGAVMTARQLVARHRDRRQLHSAQRCGYALGVRRARSGCAHLPMHPAST